MTDRRIKNRQGFTLILTCFMLVILIGSAAFAVDFAQAFRNKAELQNAADAAALAGATSLGKGVQAHAVDSALRYNQLNRVGDSTRTLRSSDVHPGTWGPGPGGGAPGFHPTTPSADDWTDPTANAVQVTTRYPVAFIFARTFGYTGSTLNVTAVAVHGSVNGDNCVRPWAIPYQTVLDALGPGKNSSYNLTEADIARLGTVMGSAATAVQFDGVRLPPGEYSDVLHTAGGDIPGGSPYRAQIGFHTCQELDDLLKTASPPPPSVFLSAGDWLKEETGIKNGPTKQGISALCGSDTCSPPYPVVVALYKPAADAPGGHCNGCWQVKYMATFMLVGYDNPSKSPIGFFRDTTASSGSFTPTAGPLSKNALVK